MNLSYPTLGLCGEAGEVAEKVKKFYRDGITIEEAEWKRQLAKELGDVLWYVTAIGLEIGYDLETIAKMNMSKLLARRESNTLHGSGDNREE